MRPIAIIGGAFDPVTLGHLELIEVVEREGMTAVCLPCGDRHSFDKQMLPAAHRVELLRLAIGPREICQIEIDHGTFRAADTYPHLLAKYGSIIWVIGSDNANCMDRWHQGERLKQIIPFLVVARIGHPLTVGGEWCLAKPHRYIGAGVVREVSSTMARQLMAQRDWTQLRTVLPPAVADRIQARGWYADGTGP